MTGAELRKLAEFVDGLNTLTMNTGVNLGHRGDELVVRIGLSTLVLNISGPGNGLHATYSLEPT